jgi:hypothetical protein
MFKSCERNAFDFENAIENQKLIIYETSKASIKSLISV